MSPGRKTIEREQQALLRLHDRIAGHRAGIVDDEDQLARQELRRRVERGRRDHGEQIVLAADGLIEQRGLRRGRRLRLPHQLEILVGRDAALRERERRRVVAGPLQRDLMIGARDVAEREAGIERHLDRNGIDLRRLGGIEHRRRDAVAVRHRIARQRLAAVIDRRDLAALGIVAGRDDQREAQRIDACVLLHRLLIFDADDDRFVRADIGHRVGEDVGPLLLDQARLLPGVLGGLIGPLGVVAAFDLALDHARADLHAQRIDGRLLGERKHIDAFQPTVRMGSRNAG